MSDPNRDRLLGQCLEEYHRRRAIGETVSVEEWRERLGDAYAEFTEVLSAASALDDLVEPPRSKEALPRPFGEYTLTRLLGRGAMGVVYEAVHRDLGRTVALKVLRTGFEEDPLAYERFRREARACAQIQHDHIVTIYEAGSVDGRPFYAMAVLEGRSLQEVINEDGAFNPKDLCRGLADIADALGAMHDAGIIHRDVKPANIMVQPDGRMILADFGIARSSASQTLTATGQALGTPLYMSPEQLLGRKADIDGLSDIYGLGATLYEALAGRPPFKASDMSSLMRMILAERPKPLVQAAPEVPLECSFISMKAMEKKKPDRYQTAEAMRKDLLAFAEGGRVEGRPVSHLRYTLRRHKWRILAAAAVLVLLVGSVLWFLSRDATLTVLSFPVAQVVVDGEELGSTPIDVTLAPGPHDLVLRQQGFGERKHRIDLASGETRTLETALIASDADDPEALRRIAQELDVALKKFEDSDRMRGGKSKEPVQVLYPRGLVRLTDLGNFRVDVPDSGFEIDGEIRFVRKGEVLANVPFFADLTWTIEALPAALTEALAIGDEVEWGYFPTEGDPVTETFKVVGDAVADRLAGLEKRLKDQPPAVLGHLRTQIYLDAGFYAAAFEEARRMASEKKDSDRTWRAMLAAVQGMDLADTQLSTEVAGRFDRRGVE